MSPFEESPMGVKSFGMGVTNIVQQQQIISMEDDEYFSDVETVHIINSTFFSF